MANLRKKILFLVTQSEWGGAQEYIFNLATNLDKNQYEVLVLAGRGNGELFNKLSQAQISWQKLKYTRRAINPTLDKLAVWELYKIFKKEQPDVIHLNSSKIGFLGSIAARLCQGFGRRRAIAALATARGQGKFKIIYTAHGWVFTEPLPYLTKKLYFWIEKTSAKWKDAIITVCEANRQIALQHNFKSNIITIHNAVNPKQLSFLSKENARNFLKLLPTDPVIGTIANFYKTKGLNFLIEAAGNLVKDYPNLKTVIIGDGPERKNLEALILKLNLTDKVILTGSLPKAHQYLKAFDLFVLSSVKEGLPYAVLQAMAAEIPIVATRVGGLPEILPNECLVKTNGAIHESPLQLRDKISEYLAGRLPLPQYKPISFEEFLNKTIALY
ncbi:MAG: glycosyltransferase [Candidatus Komeilibacteria bacterium]|nr:glycosyltransferase [Candidatus Komeilibacteria bacterium]